MPRLDGLTLVVGLGKSGLSAARALKALGATFAVTDSRPDPPGLAAFQAEFPGLPCHLGGFDPAVFAGAARLLVSPGVAVATPVIAEAAARGVPIWGDIELLARLTQVPVAAITGSNGKSTVTTLLGLMAERAGVRAAVGGNLGAPALEVVAAGRAGRWRGARTVRAGAVQFPVGDHPQSQRPSGDGAEPQPRPHGPLRQPGGLHRRQAARLPRRRRDGGQRRRPGGDGDGRSGATGGAFHPG